MIKFDSELNVQEYTVILSKRNHQHIGQIKNIDELTSKINLNSANEIAFTVYKYDNEIEEQFWNDITNFKYVWIKELNEYYEIYVEINESGEIYKSIIGTSACECELSQTFSYGLEVNTPLDISRHDYVKATTFYNAEDHRVSLLHRALSNAPHYSIKHVDDSLVGIQRTFSINSSDIYSLLTQTIATEIGCLFLFDSVDRSISVYDLNTVCKDCGERGEFGDVCPNCGSTNLKYYGKDTSIYVDVDNLAENIIFSTDTDSIKNCFKLEGGDDNMTSAIINLNPNGSKYIYYFSEDQKIDMSEELRSRLDSYDELHNSFKIEHQNIISKIYEYIDKDVYYTSVMMPTKEETETNSKIEADKLTVLNLSPTSLLEVTTSTSVSTVNAALRNYAKVHIKTGYFKVEINESSFEYVGTDLEGYNYGYWYGNFKVTSYSDETDFTLSEPIRITINNNYKSFLEQKISKKISEDKDDSNIYDVLSIKDLVKFKDALRLYCLNRLISFNDAIQNVIDIMIEEEQANESADLYNELYVPYRDKLLACQHEIDIRKATIDSNNELLDTQYSLQNKIHEILDFKKYLGDELYTEFCVFRREDIYSNQNYISDGLNNNTIFKRAEEFMKEAKNELIKSGESQHSITSTLLNLLSMHEFQPLVDMFDVGNFIRISIDNKIYRLRLTSYQISFDDLSNIDVEFSDLTKISSGTSDLESILNQANSIASSYDYIQHQVKDSQEQSNIIKNWVKNGLDTTNVQIVNSANNQNIVWGENGLLARRKDDITELYDDCQLKIINNGLYTTSDNWNTIDTAIGKSFWTNPNTGEKEILYGIQAKKIVGELVAGEKLHIRSKDNSFILDENGVTFKASSIDWDQKLDADKIDGLEIVITKIQTQYYLSTSQIQMISGTWINTAPIWEKGKYIWTRNELYYSNGEIVYSSPICATGQDGQNGIDGSDGQNGADGVSVSNIIEYYALSISPSIMPTNWSTVVPLMTEINKYLWNYEVVSLSDNSVINTPKKVIGIYGDKGETGSTGSTGNGVSDIINYYLATPLVSGITVSTEGWTTTVQSVSDTKKYLWNYEKISYTNGDSTITTPTIIGTYGDKGSDGKGVTSVDVLYYLSTSNVTLSGGSWVTTSPSWQNGKYMWSKTVISYTDLSTKETSPVCITGSSGATGSNGDDGIGVSSIIEQYYSSTSNSIQSGGSWSTTYPGWVNGKYIWTRSIINYTNETSMMTNPICVTGSQGSQGENGIGIKNVSNYYVLSDVNTTAPISGWSTTVPIMTNTNKYLWNYEIITKTDNSTIITEKRIIGVYGNTGENGLDGSNGTDGRGILSIVEYYLTSSLSSGVTISTSGWNTTMQTTTAINRYLWNYEIVRYTDGTSYTSIPIIIGTHGAAGSNGIDGKGISNIETEYYLSTSKTSIIGGSWSAVSPTWIKGNYLWTRTKITWINPSSITYTNPIVDDTWEAMNGIEERVYNSEQKLTSKQWSLWFTEAVNGGVVSSTKFTMDKLGVHIVNGGFDISNNAGTKVLYADSLGNLVLNNLTLNNITANSGKFTGEINSVKGSIGGIDITSSGISKTSNLGNNVSQTFNLSSTSSALLLSRTGEGIDFSSSIEADNIRFFSQGSYSGSEPYELVMKSYGIYFSYLGSSMGSIVSSPSGGLRFITSNAEFTSSVNLKAGFTNNQNGVTTTINSYNSSYTHYQSNAPQGHWFNRDVRVAGNVYAGSSYNRRLAFVDEIQEVIWSGSLTIPSMSSGSSAVVTLTQSLDYYDAIIIERGDRLTSTFIIKGTYPSFYNGAWFQSTTSGGQGFDVFCGSFNITAYNKISFSGNAYTGISTSNVSRFVNTYTGVPVTKIIGVK